MSERPALRALADRCGIAPEYEDILEHRRRETSDRTREALLAAMGFDGSTEGSCSVALDRLDHERRRAAVDAIAVVEAQSEGAPRIRVRLPARLQDAKLNYEIRLEPHAHDPSAPEGTSSDSGRVEGTLADRDRTSDGSTIELPIPEGPLGYHRLAIRLEARGSDALPLAAEQCRIVVPSACPDPAQRFDRPAFGICANLFSVRGRGSEGIGDLHDLGDLLAWCDRIGGAFVGIGPLLACRNVGPEVSPYSPLTRVFLNPLYLRVGAIPELEKDPDARRLYEVAGLSRLDDRPRIEHAELDARKRTLLHRLFAAFRRHELERDTARARAFLDFVREGGNALRDYATFRALEEELGPRSTWSEILAGPECEEVRRYREERSETIDFHLYLQFELDRQLAGSAGRAEAALITDLPVGTVPDGFDPWAFPSTVASGATLGAPPDPFNPDGQDWALAPLSPHGLVRDRFRYWTHVLRSALRHAGAVRIDHVMGLVRQFWIPEGHAPSEGAYVSFPSRALFGILALEASRRDAVVIGEDLGTLPDELPDQLAKWKILSSKVLYFERDADDEFRSAAHYPGPALATVNTHDLPTFRGYFEGRDLLARHESGRIDAGELELARERRKREGKSLWRRLRDESATGGEDTNEDPERVPAVERLRAAHAFLAGTPSRILGVALDDLGGESEGVNLPGVPADAYPSWTRRMRLGLEEIAEDADAARALEGLAARRRDRTADSPENQESID